MTYRPILRSCFAADPPERVRKQIQASSKGSNSRGSDANLTLSLTLTGICDAAVRCVCSASFLRARVGWEVTDMIKRESNPLMQFIVGPVSPVTWTTVFLVAVWFWS